MAALLFGIGSSAAAVPAAEAATYDYDAAVRYYDPSGDLLTVAVSDGEAWDVHTSPSDDASEPSVASSPGLLAPEATRTVTIGRDMGERVIPYAKRHGYDWYGGTPRWVPRNLIERVSPRTLERIDLWFNRRWIRSEMGQGSGIVDIGEPPGYPPSSFYDMELDEVSGYCNYCRDPQP